MNDILQDISGNELAASWIKRSVKTYETNVSGHVEMDWFLNHI